MAEEKTIKHAHFIGIGGVGMSALALVALAQGMRVSGSDLRRSRYTDQVSEAGAQVSIGHNAANIGTGEDEPDVVVVSTAILENNPEYCATIERGIPVWHRAKMLAFLGRDLQTLAVSGTHGKTTTSSMLASVLDTLGEDPTFLIGGMVRSYNTNARAGSGKHYVVEADESDKSFTCLSPKAVIVTNVEADHLDHYADLDEIYEKFKMFLDSVPEDGVAVVCGDDEALVELARGCTCRVVTYGFSDGCDYQVRDYQARGVGSTFTLVTSSGEKVSGSIKQNPGAHNALNGSGVIALLAELGFDAQQVADALAEFAGVRRRFDLVDEVKGITIVDDYAHHPTEIAATIAAAKELDFNRVVVLFQPHRYTRIHLFGEMLHDSFSHAFDAADELYFMDVYSAGETPIPGVSGKSFLNVVLDNPDHPQAHYIAKLQNVIPTLAKGLQEGDLLLTMGAGDVTGIGPELAAYLAE